MKHSKGITYLTVLFVILALEAGLAATVEVWHIKQQREKEKELLFIGNQFRRAIALYYERTPGPAKQYPKTLDDILVDKRFPNSPPYLRKVYFDPIQRKREWGIVQSPDGGIKGVYSLSEKKPLKIWGFNSGYEGFENQGKYSDWKFIYEPQKSMP